MPDFKRISGLLDNETGHRAILAFLAIAIYANSFWTPFYFDDGSFIVANPTIRDIKYIIDPSKADKLNLTKDVHRFLRTRRLTYFTFWFNYKMGKLMVGGYHAVNLIIHILAAQVLYSLIIAIIGLPVMSGTALCRAGPQIALAGSLLFVAHPLQTQAVTYVVQRSAAMAGLFGMLSLLLYIRFRVSDSAANRRYLYAGSVLASFTSMYTKEIAFVIPVQIAFFEIIFFKGPVLKRATYLLPLLLTMLAIPMTLYGLGKGGAAGLSETYGAMRIQTDMPRLTYLFTQFSVLVRYLRLIVMPVGQRLDYDYPLYDTFWMPQVYWPFMILAAIWISGFYMLYRAHRGGEAGLRIAAYGILYYFIGLSVESSMLPIKDVIFEHRVYAPMAGAAMAMSAIIASAYFRLNNQSFKKALITVFASAIVLFSSASIHRNYIWSSDIRLWEDVVRKSPNISRAHNNLGNAYKDAKRLEDALREYEETIRLNPKHPHAYNNKASTLKQMGRKDEAIPYYKLAIKHYPRYTKARMSLARMYESKGMDKEAMGQYKQVLKYEAYNADARFGLASIYNGLGNSDEARVELEEALRHNPAHRKSKELLKKLQSGR